MSAALFSGGGSRASGTAASKALVEFRAGKMTMNASNLVTPDKRKGQVMVEQGDDQLMHFKWKDRTTGTVEDDLIIFPDDVEFKKVAQCTTGRVFLLKFKSSTRKLFFWMQEPKDDKDEEVCKKVNDFLNNPPAPGSSSSRGNSMGGSGGSGGLDLSNLGDSELQSLLNNMSQSQLVQLFGGGGSGLAAITNSPSSRQRSSGNTGSAAGTTAATSATTTASPATTTSTAPSTTTSSGTTSTKPTDSSALSTASSAAANIRLSDLQNVLSGLPTAQSSSSASGPSVDLSSGLTTEALQPLLENPEFVRKMKELLPEEEQAQDDANAQVRGTLHSPQFRQALGMFSSGLQTGQLAPLIREFNLGDAAIAAATKGDVEAFVKALQNKKKSPSGDEQKKKDDDDDMALD